MKKNELIKQLTIFKNKAFCHYSHYKAGQIWRVIAKEIPSPYCQKILIEWEHVQLGHGFQQACQALNSEIDKFIEYLESK